LGGLTKLTFSYLENLQNEETYSLIGDAIFVFWANYKIKSKYWNNVRKTPLISADFKTILITFLMGLKITI
tara:strand:- start:363 stop:575 length:213 start_codon:yes stop_codon:yes gene_type:complete